MHSKLAGVLLLLSALCGDALAQTSGIPVRWDWLVVSTPDFVGPFRGNLPGFKAPAPKVPLPKILPLTQTGPIFGQFEVIVTVRGQTVVEKTLRVSSREVNSKAMEALRHWRFDPASLDGKPIRVRLRVQVFEN
jgi:hypothetical protein